MLTRVLEAEAMDSPAEALDYDRMDHSAVNRLFVDDFLATKPDTSRVLDLGTGTARIPIELCQRDPKAMVTAIDLSAAMLDLARANLALAGCFERVMLQWVDAKQLGLESGRFSSVISNSIVHHVPDPAGMFAEAWRVAAPGATLFFRDLLRPTDEAELARLVALYAAEANDSQRQLFADSLRAALSLEEVRQIVARLGIEPEVRATSDRHWTWIARKPRS